MNHIVPAKRCYVGIDVAVGVQEQAEGILVPPLLRTCLTLNDISFPYSHYLASRTVVLAIVIPAKARDYVFTGVGLSVCLSVCLFVCYHDN